MKIIYYRNERGCKSKGSDSIDCGITTKYTGDFPAPETANGALTEIILPGQPQHVILRGNNRTEIFCVEADYRTINQWVEYAASVYDWTLARYLARDVP